MVIHFDDSDTCARCNESLQDQFFVKLESIDKKWHETCLRCVDCEQLLSDTQTCFYKDEKIFCKTDYQNYILFYHFRRRKLRRYQCYECKSSLESQEWAIPIDQFVVHPDCFKCVTCKNILKPGDNYCFRDGRILCESHSVDQAVPTPPLPPASLTNMTSGLLTPTSHCDKVMPIQHFAPTPSYLTPYPDTQPPKLVGRPRKKRPQQSPQIVPTDEFGFGAMDLINSVHRGEFDLYGIDGGSSRQGGKQKRMRTSFKHQQLKIMKEYFKLNTNPDSKDLTQLSEETGLQKRVLQVWFQNARAKNRKKQLGGDDSSAESPKQARLLSSSASGGGITTIEYDEDYENDYDSSSTSELNTAISSNGDNNKTANYVSNYSPFASGGSNEGVLSGISSNSQDTATTLQSAPAASAFGLIEKATTYFENL